MLNQSKILATAAALLFAGVVVEAHDPTTIQREGRVLGIGLRRAARHERAQCQDEGQAGQQQQVGDQESAWDCVHSSPFPVKKSRPIARPQKTKPPRS